MRSKTNKLIWAVPLLAVFAIAGALAILVAQPPGSVQADDAPGPVTGLTATVGKSYTEIELSWTAPATGTVTGYRIDMASATNPHVWFAHVADTGSTDTKYLDEGLTAGQSRRYRVFALNGDHTGPASIRNESAAGRTKNPSTPGPVLNVQAKAAGSKQINLSWSPPTNLGADKLDRYCIVAFDSDGTDTIAAAFASATTLSGVSTCGELDAKLPDLNASGTYLYIIVDGNTTTYEHKASSATDDDGLDAEDEWHYVVSAMTRSHDDAATHQYAAVDVSSTLSNIAKAKTAKAGGDGPVSMPGSLIAVPTSDGNVDLYWTWPDDYKRETFVWEVSTKSSFPTGSNTTSTPVTESAGNADAATPQVDNNDQSSGTSGYAYYRVRAGVAADKNNVWSSTASIPLPASEITNADYKPAIAADDPLTTTPTDDGFTAKADTTYPRNQLNLKWVDDITDSDDDGESDRPRATGHVLQYRKNVDNAPWQELEYSPYQCCTFGHQGLDAGTKYQYRIFPYYDSQDKGRIFGDPSHAEGFTADPIAPNPVRGLQVMSAGRDSLKLMWPAVTVDGGAPIIGYRVEVADDTDDNNTLAQSPTWNLVKAVETGSIYHVAADAALEYTYKDTTTALVAGDVRWFRVFAVNAANDGNSATTPPGLLPADTGPSALEGAQAEAVSGEVASTAVSPNAPKSLTAETARDNSGKLRTDRGVQLHWLAPDDHDKPDMMVTSYVIQRREQVGDAARTEWADIGTVTVGAITGRTYFTDGTEPKENEQREYRVGAKNDKGTTWSNTAEYPLADHSHVMATAAVIPNKGDLIAGTTHEVDATMHFTGAMSYSASSSDAMVASTPETAVDGKVIVTGVAPGTATITVTASDGSSGTAMKTFTVTVTAAMLITPSNVMATSTAAGELTVTWEGGENADRFLLIAVDMDALAAGTTEYDIAQTNDPAARTDKVTGLNSGNEYMVIVVAMKGSGDDLETKHGVTAANVSVQ